jgi:hypothetical protein
MRERRVVTEKPESSVSLEPTATILLQQELMQADTAIAAQKKP